MLSPLAMRTVPGAVTPNVRGRAEAHAAVPGEPQAAGGAIGGVIGVVGAAGERSTTRAEPDDVHEIDLRGVRAAAAVHDVALPVAGEDRVDVVALPGDAVVRHSVDGDGHAARVVVEPQLVGAGSARVLVGAEPLVVARGRAPGAELQAVVAGAAVHDPRTWLMYLACSALAWASAVRAWA